MNRVILHILLPCIIAQAVLGTAWASTSKEIRIVGRSEITVTTKNVFLADLATVTSIVPGNDDAIIALQKVKILPAPKPGSTTTVAASQILDALRGQGVDIQAVGYRLPRVTTVKRAGRSLLEGEILAVIESVLSTQKQDSAVREVRFDDDIQVYPGEIELRATPFNTNRPGEMGFSFEAKTQEDPPLRFDVMAAVDEWREVPVASRSIKRGNVIEVGDIQMARYNVSELPRDVAFDSETIFGLEAEKHIGVGEVFRRSKLVIPPVVEMGAHVTLLYRSGALEATATGVALQAGAIGDSIKIRNDASKKIVLGNVIEAGLVGVNK